MRSTLQSVSWALVRALFGAGIALRHGYAMVFEGRLGGVTKSIEELGWPHPHFFAWCAGLSQFFGGVLLCVGLATRPAAALLALTMIVALVHHHFDLAQAEDAALYGVVFVAMVIGGGGRYSLDQIVRLRLPFSRKSEPPPPM